MECSTVQLQPLTNIIQLENVIHKATALNTCQNVLGLTPPLNTNHMLVGQLIQALRRNSNTVPPLLQADFINVTDTLRTMHDDNAALTPTSIFIALGSFYPEVPPGTKQLTDSTSGISLPPVLTNSGEIPGRAQLTDNHTQSSALAAYDSQGQTDFAGAAYPERSQSKCPPFDGSRKVKVPPE